MQSHSYLVQSIAIASAASLIYSLLSPGLIIFLLKINYTLSPSTSGWLIINLIFGFRLKEDTSRHRGKPTGVPAIRILLFIDNKGKLTNIGDPYWDGLNIILTPPP